MEIAQRYTECKAWIVVTDASIDIGCQKDCVVDGVRSPYGLVRDIELAVGYHAVVTEAQSNLDASSDTEDLGSAQVAVGGELVPDTIFDPTSVVVAVDIHNSIS